MPGQGLHSLITHPIRQNLSPYIKCRLLDGTPGLADVRGAMTPPECRIWKAIEVSMLRTDVLSMVLVASAMSLAAEVAYAQDGKAPAPSASPQAARPRAD